MGFNVGRFIRRNISTALSFAPGGGLVSRFGGNLLASAARRTGVSVSAVQEVARRVRAQTGMSGQQILQTPQFQGQGQYYESTGVRLGPLQYSNVERAGAQVGTGGQQVVGPGCPQGFRLNRSTYVTRGGGTSKWPVGLQVHPKGTVCVRRRRRNVANAKALRRAVSRLRGFAKLALRVQRSLGLPGRRRGSRKALPGGTSIVNVE